MKLFFASTLIHLLCAQSPSIQGEGSTREFVFFADLGKLYNISYSSDLSEWTTAYEDEYEFGFQKRYSFGHFFPEAEPGSAFFNAR